MPAGRRPAQIPRLRPPWPHSSETEPPAAALVSVGEADFVKETLEKIGEVNFWKVAMKPGRPLAFGKIKNAWFFGLPGNPVSVMVWNTKNH